MSRADPSVFNISEDSICQLARDQHGRCAFTGVVGTFKCDGSDTMMSIDRIDSTGGYTVGNVQLVLWRLNRGKNNFDDDEFREHLRDQFPVDSGSPSSSFSLSRSPSLSSSL